MGNTMKKIILPVLIAFVCLTNTAQGITITTAPLGSIENNGDIFFVDVIGQTFPVTEGGSFNLGFDPLVINVLSVTIDPAWNFVNDSGTIDNSAGTLSDVLVSAFPGVNTGNFIVATLELMAVGIGNTGLILTESAINPWASGGNLINPDFINGSVTVIPLPATFWLFVSGLAGLLRFTRYKNHEDRSLIPSQ